MKRTTAQANDAQPLDKTQEIQRDEVLTDKSRLRRICFTLNNYTPEEEGAIKLIDCMWMIVARETGEEQTPHLQGAIVFKAQKTFSAIKKLAGMQRCHIEKMKGTPQDSLVYCSKQDPAPFTKGVMPKGQGTRTDLEPVAKMLLNGSSLAQVAETFPIAMIQYSRGLTVLRSYQIKPRDPKYPPTVIWIHGNTGCGKTRTAYEKGTELFGDSSRVWMSDGSLRWFAQYEGQPCAILDDLRTKHCEFSFLLRLLDRYPFRVEFKLGSVQWIPRLIFITAPLPPRTMWSLRTEEQLDQLERRCTHIIAAPRDLWRVHEMLLTEDDALVVPELPSSGRGGESFSEEDRGDSQIRNSLIPFTQDEITDFEKERRDKLESYRLDWGEEEQLSPFTHKKFYGWSEVN